jgi:hypothetical protein
MKQRNPNGEPAKKKVVSFFLEQDQPSPSIAPKSDNESPNNSPGREALLE